MMKIVTQVLVFAVGMTLVTDLQAAPAPAAKKSRIKITYKKRKSIEGSKANNKSGNKRSVPNSKQIQFAQKAREKDALYREVRKQKRDSEIVVNGHRASVKGGKEGQEKRGSELNPFPNPEGYDFADLTLPYDTTTNGGLDWDFSFNNAFIFDNVDYIDSLILKPTEDITISECRVFFNDPEIGEFSEDVFFDTVSEPDGIFLEAEEELLIDFELDLENPVDFVSYVEEIECGARSEDYFLGVADVPSELAVYYLYADINEPGKPPLPGDLNGSCSVTVDELIRSVGAALDPGQYSCSALDLNNLMQDYLDNIGVPGNPNQSVNLESYDQIINGD